MAERAKIERTVCVDPLSNVYRNSSYETQMHREPISVEEAQRILEGQRFFALVYDGGILTF